MKPRIALIGPGRVGCAVVKRLYATGYPVTAVVSRTQENADYATTFIGCQPAAATTTIGQAAQAEVILLAVPDDRISDLAKQLHEEADLSQTTTLVHFSGLHPAAILSGADSGYMAVSIHPLLPFANREMAAERLNGCPCAIEGDAAAGPLAEELVRAFGGRSFHLPSSRSKTLYHTAACLASNYLITLTAVARDLMTCCGVDKEQAMDMLIPLHQATSENLVQLGPETALTGPIVRGDLGTVNMHLGSLEQYPEVLELYRSLGKATVDLAASSGRLSEEDAGELRQRFTDPNREQRERS